MVVLWLPAVRGPNGTSIVGSLCQLYEASEEDVQKMIEKANDLITRLLKISPISCPQNESEQLADIDTSKVFFLVLADFVLNGILYLMGLVVVLTDFTISFSH